MPSAGEHSLAMLVCIRPAPPALEAAHLVGVARGDGEGHRRARKAGVRHARQVAADVDVAGLLLADRRRDRVVDLLVRVLHRKHLHLRAARRCLSPLQLKQIALFNRVSLHFCAPGLACLPRMCN